MLPPNCLYFLPKASAPGASLLLRCLRRLKNFMSFIVGDGRLDVGGVGDGVWNRERSGARCCEGRRSGEEWIEGEGEGEGERSVGEQKRGRRGRVVEQRPDPM